MLILQRVLASNCASPTGPPSPAAERQSASLSPYVRPPCAARDKASSVQLLPTSKQAEAQSESYSCMVSWATSDKATSFRFADGVVLLLP